VKKELSGVQDDDTVPWDVRVQFIVGTFLTVLTQWLERNPGLKPSQVDVMFRRLAIHGIVPSIHAESRGARA